MPTLARLSVIALRPRVLSTRTAPLVRSITEHAYRAGAKLVTPDEAHPPTTAELLEMAGEAEELTGRPVDFVLRPSLDRSPNRSARERILATAVCVYGS